MYSAAVFQKVFQGDKSLEGEESSGWPLEVDNDQLRAITKADPLTTMQEVAAAAAAKSLQSCLTLCNPMDCSLPGSSIHGIFQARVLEWGAIAFSEEVAKELNIGHSMVGN